MAGLTSYQGLAAVVTGASSGIGRLVALRLAREGARVGLVARRANVLDALDAEIREAGGDALALPCDVAERKQVSACSRRALEHFGAIDLLINNAGYGHHRTFLEWDLSDMERIMRVNYFGALYFTKLLLPQMVQRGSDRDSGRGRLCRVEVRHGGSRRSPVAGGGGRGHPRLDRLSRHHQDAVLRPGGLATHATCRAPVDGRPGRARRCDLPIPGQGATPADLPPRDCQRIHRARTGARLHAPPGETGHARCEEGTPGSTARGLSTDVRRRMNRKMCQPDQRPIQSCQ